MPFLKSAPDRRYTASMETVALDIYYVIYGFLGVPELLGAQRVSRRIAGRLSPAAAPAVWAAARPRFITDMGVWLTELPCADLCVLEAAYGISAQFEQVPLAKRLLRSSVSEAACAACQRGQLTKAQWLFDRFADISRRDCLYAACKGGPASLAAVDWLIASELNEVDDAFRVACAHGHLEHARHLVRAHIDVRANDNAAVRDACYGGHLPVVQWLVTEYALTPADLCTFECYAIRRAASNGHHAVVSYLIDRFGSAVVYKSAFGSICTSCPLDVVQRVASQLGITDAGVNEFDYLEFNYLEVSCRAGQLATVMWLADRAELSDYGRETLLHGACINGHLRVAAWLVTHFEYHMAHPALLWSTCAAGHLATAQWLVSQFKREWPAAGVALVDVCRAGHLTMAQWIVETFDLEECGNAPFAACAAGHLAVVRWLLSTFAMPGDMRRHTHIKACAAGYLDIVKALTEDDPSTAETVASEQFREACTGGHLAIAEWLVARHRWLQLERQLWVDVCISGQTAVARWLAATFSREIALYRSDALADDKAIIHRHNKQHFIYWYVVHFRISTATCTNL